MTLSPDASVIVLGDPSIFSDKAIRIFEGRSSNDWKEVPVDMGETNLDSVAISFPPAGDAMRIAVGFSSKNVVKFLELSCVGDFCPYPNSTEVPRVLDLLPIEHVDDPATASPTNDLLVTP